MGLSRTVSEINGDFIRKRKIFPPRCILRPLKGFSLELGIGAGDKKPEARSYRAEEKV